MNAFAKDIFVVFSVGVSVGRWNFVAASTDLSLTRHRLVYVLQPLNCYMIARIGSSFVQHTDGLPVQGHELSFEAKITYSGRVFLAIAIIVLEEQGD